MASARKQTADVVAAAADVFAAAADVVAAAADVVAATAVVAAADVGIVRPGSALPECEAKLSKTWT